MNWLCESYSDFMLLEYRLPTRTNYPSVKEMDKVTVGMKLQQVLDLVGLPLDKGGSGVTDAAYQTDDGQAYIIRFNGAAEGWMTVAQIKKAGKLEVDPEKDWWPESESVPVQDKNDTYISIMKNDQSRFILNYAYPSRQTYGEEIYPEGLTDYPSNAAFKQLYKGMLPKYFAKLVGYPAFRDNYKSSVTGYEYLSAEGNMYEIRMASYVDAEDKAHQVIGSLYLIGTWDESGYHRNESSERKQIF